MRIPGQLMALLEACSCHRSPQRWGLMYRVLWRISRGERHLLDLAADADVRALGAMAKGVERDCHKMHAFVRFREARGAAGEACYVAWFEPQHRILRRAAPFFVDRFASMRWTIVTPEGAAQWDRERLGFLDDAGAVEIPGGDDHEALWRAYYASIFNPARLNERKMQRDMPKRYWRNLPEARDIAGLARAARPRVARMLESPPRDNDRWKQYAGRLDPPDGAPQDAPLDERIRRCTRCPLYRQATQAVCGSGPRPAALMLVGEQPGDEEDLRGLPFVGPAGRLLDRALAEAGVARADVYLTNGVKHFKWEPRGKRRIHKTPAQAEIAACADWLEQEIGAVQPRAILALGASALAALLGRREPIGRARELELAHRRGIPIVATYHPAAVLRAEGERERALYAALRDDLRRAQALSNR